MPLIDSTVGWGHSINSYSECGFILKVKVSSGRNAPKFYENYSKSCSSSPSSSANSSTLSGIPWLTWSGIFWVESKSPPKLAFWAPPSHSSNRSSPTTNVLCYTWIIIIINTNFDRSKINMTVIPIAVRQWLFIRIFAQTNKRVRLILGYER